MVEAQPTDPVICCLLCISFSVIFPSLEVIITLGFNTVGAKIVEIADF